MTSVSGGYNSAGMASAQMLERLGFNGALSSAIGAELDASVGDVAGVMQNLSSMYTKGLTGGIERLFGGGLPGACHVGRPGEALAQSLDRAGTGFNPFGGISREAPFGEGLIGRSLEQAINSNPMFKSQMERMLGGVIIPDGAKDGKLTKTELTDTRLHGLFDRADTNKDGMVTREELEALFARETIADDGKKGKGPKGPPPDKK